MYLCVRGIDQARILRGHVFVCWGIDQARILRGHVFVCWGIDQARILRGHVFVCWGYRPSKDTERSCICVFGVSTKQGY